MGVAEPAGWFGWVVLIEMLIVGVFGYRWNLGIALDNITSIEYLELNLKTCEIDTKLVSFAVALTLNSTTSGTGTILT